MGDRLFHIPSDVQAGFLPARNSPIRYLLDFDKLPGVYAMTPDLERVEDWLSSTPPADGFIPQHLPLISLPPRQIVDKLVAATSTPRFYAFKSVFALHLELAGNDDSIPVNLPLWVLTYWSEAHHARLMQQTWQSAKLWVELHCRGSLEGRELQRNVLQVFHGLAFSADLSGPEIGLGSTANLAALLSDQRLTGSHIHQMTALLRRRLDNNATLISEIHAADLEFYELLQDAMAQDITILDTHRRYASLRAIELDLIHGFKTSVGGIIWIRGNHYVPFVLNFAQRYLSYGDSMNPKGRIPPSVSSVFMWWIQRLISQSSALEPGNPFPDSPSEWLQQLPIAIQRAGDDFSCGVLALNALEHHLLPEIVPLLPADRHIISQARMKAFVAIANIHLDMPTVCGSFGSGLFTGSDIITEANHSRRRRFSYRR